MSRDPWSDRELTILYRYVNVPLEADLILRLKRVLPGRTASAIIGRVQRLRSEAGIAISPHFPHEGAERIRLASEELADRIRAEIEKGYPPCPQVLRTAKSAVDDTSL